MPHIAARMPVARLQQMRFAAQIADHLLLQRAQVLWHVGVQQKLLDPRLVHKQLVRRQGS